MAKIGLGIIGFCGHYGLALEGWEALLPFGIEIELVAVASVDQKSIPTARLKALQTPFKIEDDWRALIRNPAISVVVVDGPFHLHAEMSRCALLAGKHVFCEKLVALTRQDLRDLESAHTASQSHFWSMMSLRYHAGFYSALQAIKNQAIGAIRSIQFQKSYKHGQRPAWYNERELYGGTIGWVGSHALDYIYALAGDVQTVSALQHRGNSAYEMAALVQCRHRNGILSSVTMDFYRPESAPTHSDDRVRVVGDAGIVEVIANEVRIIDAMGERNLDLQFPALNTFTDGILVCVQNKPNGFSAVDVFAVTRLCLSARESADAGGAISEVR